MWTIRPAEKAGRQSTWATAKGREQRPTWMMLVPLRKLVKLRMTSWLRDSTDAFQELPKPRISCVTRADRQRERSVREQPGPLTPSLAFLVFSQPSLPCWATSPSDRVPTLLPRQHPLTFFPSKSLSLSSLNQSFGLLHKRHQTPEGGRQQLFDEFLESQAGTVRSPGNKGAPPWTMRQCDSEAMTPHRAAGHCEPGTFQ